MYPRGMPLVTHMLASNAQVWESMASSSANPRRKRATYRGSGLIIQYARSMQHALRYGRGVVLPMCLQHLQLSVGRRILCRALPQVPVYESEHAHVRGSIAYAGERLGISNQVEVDEPRNRRLVQDVCYGCSRAAISSTRAPLPLYPEPIPNPTKEG
jgi:hypothetical protein